MSWCTAGVALPTARVLRSAYDELLARLGIAGPAYLAALLADASRAVEQAHRHQSVAVVWPGWGSGVATSRLTAATVVGLIGEAAEDPMVSYAAHVESVIGAALAQRPRGTF